MGLTAKQLVFSIASVIVGGGIVSFEMEQNGQVKKKGKKLNQRLQHLSRQ